jgi:exopolysaccharide biosynthesis WecB/TagA/CpsF family protein
VVTSTVAHGGDAVISALHVGGLNQASHQGFATALQNADLVCADGMSIVVLARMAGARGAERAPTTDVGIDIMREAAVGLGRPIKIGMLGGPSGLAQRAADRLLQLVDCTVVWIQDGYQTDQNAVLTAASEAAPDLLLVGLGSPRETVWADEHRHSLSGCTIVTCGGWFSFLAGEEKRAPAVLQRLGLEWTSRVMQSPRRLLGRYSRGAVSTAVAAVRILARRASI